MLLPFDDSCADQVHASLPTEEPQNTEPHFEASSSSSHSSAGVDSGTSDSQDSDPMQLGRDFLGALARTIRGQTDSERRLAMEQLRRRQWLVAKIRSACIRVVRAPSDLLSAAAHIYAGETNIDSPMTRRLEVEDQHSNSGADYDSESTNSRLADGRVIDASEEAVDPVAEAGGYLLMEAKSSLMAHMAASPEDSDLHPLAMGLGPPPCIRAAGVALCNADRAVRAVTGGAYTIRSLPSVPGGEVVPTQAMHVLYDLLERTSTDACRRLGARVNRELVRRALVGGRRIATGIEDVAAKVPTPHAPVLLRRSLA